MAENPTSGSTDLVLADAKLTGLPERFQPKNLTELMAWAKLVNSSGLAPKGMNDAGIILAVQMGAELNITPTQALQNIAIINGRPSIWGDLGLALFKRDAAYLSFEERSPDEAWKAKEGWCKIVMKRDPSKPIIRTFTYANAEEAGLTRRGGPDAPWTKYPGRMLMFRARWWAMRDAEPGVFKGLAGREEQHDIVDVTDSTRVDGETIRRPQRNSEGVSATDVDNFLKDQKPVANGGGNGTGGHSAPVIDRSKLVKVMVHDSVKKTAGETIFYVLTIEASSGGKSEASTFDSKLHDIALSCKGGFALILTKNVEKKGKTYVNLLHIEKVAEEVEVPPTGEREAGMEG